MEDSKVRDLLTSCPLNIAWTSWWKGRPPLRGLRNPASSWLWVISIFIPESIIEDEVTSDKGQNARRPVVSNWCPAGMDVWGSFFWIPDRFCTYSSDHKWVVCIFNGVPPGSLTPVFGSDCCLCAYTIIHGLQLLHPPCPGSRRLLARSIPRLSCCPCRKNTR